MRKAECDKVRNDGGNFGKPLQWDDEMKTNDGGIKENVQRQTEKDRAKINETENYRKRRETKLIFREGGRGRKFILRMRVRIKGQEEAEEVEKKERKKERKKEKINK